MFTILIAHWKPNIIPSSVFIDIFWFYNTIISGDLLKISEICNFNIFRYPYILVILSEEHLYKMG